VGAATYPLCSPACYYSGEQFLSAARDISAPDVG